MKKSIKKSLKYYEENALCIEGVRLQCYNVTELLRFLLGRELYMKKFGKRIRNAERSLAAYDDALYDLEVPEEAFGEDVIPAEEETYYVEEEYYEDAELTEEDAYYEEVALSEEMYYSEEGEFSEEEEYYQGEELSEEEDYPDSEAVEEVYATEDYDTEEYMPEQEIYYSQSCPAVA